MTNYENDIMNLLDGETPRQKHFLLVEMLKGKKQYDEMFEEMVGLFSKRYDDEECGIHFKQRMKFLINKYQS